MTETVKVNDHTVAILKQALALAERGEMLEVSIAAKMVGHRKFWGKHSFRFDGELLGIIEMFKLLSVIGVRDECESGEQPHG